MPEQNSKTEQNASQTLAPTLYAKTLDQFETPPPNDPNELIESRFLCRGGGLLIIGATGIGKSSFAMQLAISWALGRECFGLRPKWETQSLFIQSENDDGDVAEFRDGIYHGLELTGNEMEKAAKAIRVFHETDTCGPSFVKQVAEPLVKSLRPFLIWIDPALGYIGGDAKSQHDVGSWLRANLAPMLRNYTLSAVLLHHSNKPIANGRKDMLLHERDYAYLGTGSIEWPNWSRAVITLKEVEPNLFEMRAPKRGQRLKWKEPKRYLRHRSDKEIFWIDAEAPTPKPTASQQEKLERQEANLRILQQEPTGLSFKPWLQRAVSLYDAKERTFCRDMRDLEKGGAIAQQGELWVAVVQSSKDVFAKYRKPA